MEKYKGIIKAVAALAIAVGTAFGVTWLVTGGCIVDSDNPACVETTE